MTQVTFMGGGRMSSNNISKMLQAELLSKADAQLNQRISHLICDTHGGKPVANLDLQTSQVNISGCCEDIIYEASRLFESGKG